MFGKPSSSFNDSALLTGNSSATQEYSGFGSMNAGLAPGEQRSDFGLTQSLLQRQQEMDKKDPFDMLKQMMDSNKLMNNFKPNETSNDLHRPDNILSVIKNKDLFLKAQP